MKSKLNKYTGLTDCKRFVYVHKKTGKIIVGEGNSRRTVSLTSLRSIVSQGAEVLDAVESKWVLLRE